MPFSPIPLNDGGEIPAIAYGTGTANFGQDVRRLIKMALETGFTHIDTAQVYKNEDSVGAGIRDSGRERSSLYVTTKYGGGAVEEEFKRSLRKLGLKFVDLYLIHFPKIIVNGDYKAVWREFESIKGRGFAKSIGVSNFTVEDLKKILSFAEVKPAVNQIELHPYNYKENKQLLEYHDRHDIVTEAYSPLAPITRYSGGPVKDVVTRIAERLGITQTQVLLLWTCAKGAVIVTTSRRREHLEEYLRVGDLPPLSREDVESIDRAGAKGPPV